MSKTRDQNNCPLKCKIDCRANLRGGECKAPFIEAETAGQRVMETIRQYSPDVYKALEDRAKSSVFAFEKDYFDGAHELFIILRNKGLLK